MNGLFSYIFSKARSLWEARAALLGSKESGRANVETCINCSVVLPFFFKALLGFQSQSKMAHLLSKQKLRKRKRETLEDEADIDEVELEERRAKDTILPSMLELPEDDTGLQIPTKTLETCICILCVIPLPRTICLSLIPLARSHYIAGSWWERVQQEAYEDNDVAIDGWGCGT